MDICMDTESFYLYFRQASNQFLLWPVQYKKFNSLSWLLSLNSSEPPFICSGSRRDFRTNERRHVDV